MRTLISALRHPVVAVLALSLSLASASPQSERKPLVFSAELRVVVLQATVRKKDGAMVTTLQRDAFTVYENGKTQPVTLFHRDDVPVSLGIAIDNSGSMRLKRARVEAAALAFVRASNPEDEVFVLNFADKVQVDVPFTQDLRLLEAGIARVDSIGGTAIRDAVAAGEAYLEKHALHERKALLVITDGVDNASVATTAEIRSRADRSEITIHAIGLLSDEAPGRAKKARNDLDDLVEPTGGVAYFPASVEAIDAVALDLARQIRSQYTIGYSPLKQELDGSYRKLRVAVSGEDDLVVRTRAGYVAGSPSSSHSLSHR